MAAPPLERTFAGLPFEEAWDRYASTDGAPLVHVRTSQAGDVIDAVFQPTGGGAPPLANVGLAPNASPPEILEMLFPSALGSRSGESVSPCRGQVAPPCEGQFTHNLDGCSDPDWCDWIYYTIFSEEGTREALPRGRYGRAFRSYEAIFAHRNRSDTRVSWRSEGSDLYGLNAIGVGDGYQDWESGLRAPVFTTYDCSTPQYPCNVFAFERYGYGEWLVLNAVGGDVENPLTLRKDILSRWCADYTQTDPTDHEVYNVSTRAEHAAIGGFEYKRGSIVKGRCWL